MAMTELGFSEIRIVGNAFHVGSLGPKRITFGRATLSSGAIELETGLKAVDGVFATGIQEDATEALVLNVREDLPLASGTVTIDGSLVDEGSATKDGGSSTFNWIAIGE